MICLHLFWVFLHLKFDFVFIYFMNHSSLFLTMIMNQKKTNQVPELHQAHECALISADKRSLYRLNVRSLPQTLMVYFCSSYSRLHLQLCSTHYTELSLSLCFLNDCEFIYVLWQSSLTSRSTLSFFTSSEDEFAQMLERKLNCLVLLDNWSNLIWWEMEVESCRKSR